MTCDGLVDILGRGSVLEHGRQLEVLVLDDIRGIFTTKRFYQAHILWYNERRDTNQFRHASLLTVLVAYTLAETSGGTTAWNAPVGVADQRDDFLTVLEDGEQLLTDNLGLCLARLCGGLVRIKAGEACDRDRVASAFEMNLSVIVSRWRTPSTWHEGYSGVSDFAEAINPTC